MSVPDVGVDVGRVLEWAMVLYFALIVCLLVAAALRLDPPHTLGQGVKRETSDTSRDAVDRAIAEYERLDREERPSVSVTTDTAPTLPAVRAVAERPAPKRVRMVPRSGLCVASGACFDFAQLRPVNVRDGEYGRN